MSRHCAVVSLSACFTPNASGACGCRAVTGGDAARTAQRRGVRTTLSASTRCWRGWLRRPRHLSPSLFLTPAPSSGDEASSPQVSQANMPSGCSAVRAHTTDRLSAQPTVAVRPCRPRQVLAADANTKGYDP